MSGHGVCVHRKWGDIGGRTGASERSAIKCRVAVRVVFAPKKCIIKWTCVCVFMLHCISSA